MASRQFSGPTGGGRLTAPVAHRPADIRNLVLVGPSGSGKTTLVETLLVAAGVLNRPGTTAEGTTVSDFDESEHRQQRSVGLALAPLVHEGVKVNLLDAPGYADFVGELRAGLRAADCALFVLAASEGVDASTAALWRECAEVGMPRVVVVSKLDHARADYDGVVRQARDAFGDRVVPVFLPEGDGLVGLITGEHGHDEQRATLIEAVIEESEDETLMERYLAGDDVDAALLVADLEKAVSRASFHPVVPVDSATGVGARELLDLVVSGFPSPSEHPAPAVFTPSGKPGPVLTCDPDGPLVAEVVKTTSDPYVGRVSLVRVFSGTLRPDATVHVSGHLSDFYGPRDAHGGGHDDHDEDERIGALSVPLGRTLRPAEVAVAGDICAIGRLSRAETGDTLSDAGAPLVLRPWQMPEPLLPLAVAARAKTDEDKLAQGLARLVAEDDQVELRVPLRETFAEPASGHGRHVKQSGGHGQFAVCQIEVEPLPGGSGLEFVDKVVGGSVPRQFIGSVEKGVRAQMQRGLVAGHPVVDIRVTLTDGKAHSVDSSDMAFQTAGALALKDAAAGARTCLLEPVDELVVLVPDDLVGTVMGDLSGRRGRVVGSGPEGDRTVVRAEVPQVELTRYAVDLRAASHGAASFSRRFARFQPVPEHVAPLLTS